MRPLQFTLLFISLFFARHIFAQNYAKKSMIDSMKNELKEVNLHDTVYINLLMGVGELTPIFRTTYWDTITKACAKAIAANPNPSTKERLLTFLSSALNNIGYVYKNQGDLASGLEYYKRSLKISTEIGDNKGIANILNNIGLIYKNQGNIALGLEYYHKSLRIYEQIEQPDGTLGNKKGIAKCLYNIGSIYKSQGELTSALESLNKSLKMYTDIDDKYGMAYSLNSIGKIYILQEDINEGLSFLFRSLKTREEIGDKKGVAISVNNIGAIYHTQGDFVKALTYHNKGLKISEQIGDKFGVASCLNNIGTIYMEQGQFARAEIHIKKSLQLLNAMGYPAGIKKASGLLYRIYAEAGKYKEALSMYELSIKMRDSVNNEQTQKAAIKQEMQYEYEKKTAADSIKTAEQQKVLDAQILAQEAQLSQEKTFKYSLFGGLGLVVLFSLFVMNRLKITRKQKEQIEHKNNSLNERNAEIAHQKELVEHKNKEVLDSIIYAERIQSAILPPLSLIKQCLPQSFVLYKPKDIVAGDFYWLENIGDDTYFAAADCTGHGVPGAMMSVMCSNALTKSVKELGLVHPGEILDATNKIIEGIFERSEQMVLDGMDLAMCKLNLKTNKLEYAGANNPLWIVQRKFDKESEQLLEIKADKQPIGQYDNRMPYTNHLVQLKQGDTIYIFSDGFVDQFGGPKGKKFKAKPFKALLLSIQNESMDKQLGLIDQAFAGWKGDIEQIDDVCIIGVKI